jgi:putative membrane protein
MLNRIRLRHGSSGRGARYRYGLAYGLIADSRAFQVLFLCCVIVAGVYGTVTATRRILFVQVIPRALALLLVLLT